MIDKVMRQAAQFMRKATLRLSSAVMVSMILCADYAHAAPPANTANNIAGNIVSSISALPTLLSALSYLAGITLGTLGVLKVKDHVEQPTQAQLKDGAIRLAAGGALFSLPIIFEAMSAAIGNTDVGVVQASVPDLEY